MTMKGKANSKNSNGPLRMPKTQISPIPLNASVAPI